MYGLAHSAAGAGDSVLSTVGHGPRTKGRGCITFLHQAALVLNPPHPHFALCLPLCHKVPARAAGTQPGSEMVCYERQRVYYRYTSRTKTISLWNEKKPTQHFLGVIH